MLGEVTEIAGSSLSILIERIFWIGLGVFLGATILKSSLDSIKSLKNGGKTMESKLKELANKASEENA